MPEPERVKGLIINKFRGDARLFDDGVRFLESYTGIPVLGVIPYMASHEIEQEDSLGVQAVQRVSEVKNAIELVICRHPYISNFTDIEPFLNEPDVTVRWVETVEAIGQPDILLLPGTKSTIADLRYWKEQGLGAKLKALKEDAWIVGLCGGFQMFAETLSDPEGHDGYAAESEEGFGLVPNMHVLFEKQKVVQRQSGIVEFAERPIKVEGYEIHHGKAARSAHPLLQCENTVEGHFRERLLGTHLHGFFRDPHCRSAFLAPIRKKKNLPSPAPEAVSDPFDRWAKHVKEHLDWQKVEEIMEASR